MSGKGSGRLHDRTKLSDDRNEKSDGMLFLARKISRRIKR